MNASEHHKTPSCATCPFRAAYDNEVTPQEALDLMLTAENSNKAKSRFLARMSHELRTPITAVLGISEIQLQNPLLASDTEDAFAKIHNSSKLLLGLINDLLDISKIDAGKMALLQEEYEVASLISNASLLHLTYLGDKDIRFRIHVDEEIPAYLIGDAVRIEQVLSNLLSNAFKFTESGSVDVSFKCTVWTPLNQLRETDESSYSYATLTISISDTGVGMSKEQISNIFQDYIRFYENKNADFSGTGLGMSIVYNLVDLMGAFIEVDSEVGVGTTVIVNIPQKVVNPQVLGKTVVQNLKEFKTSADSELKHFKPESMPYGRMLVVDDVDANLYVAKGMLELYDITVDTCTSGYEALEKVKQGEVYDIVFMDHMMPSMNGTKTMRAMRELGYTYPIVVFTANAMVGRAEGFIQKGFDDFISKPIQAKQLNPILNKFIRDKQPPEVIEAARTDALIRASDKAKSRDVSDFQSNADLLKKLQSDFASKQKHIVKEISQAIDAGDNETAHRLAHTLKGLARLIHESALAQAAEYVENLFDEGAIPPPEILAALESELTRVIENIGEIAEERTHDNAKDEAIAVLDKLKPLLEMRKSECQNLLAELRLIPEAAILVRQVEKFKFKAALESLGILRDILEK